ncbi:MAG: hypothetical protein QG614_452, partial [Patescibacteria group bacterium]|nr:hypothetical protein [Patescibacteria group bacterium]
FSSQESILSLQNDLQNKIENATTKVEEDFAKIAPELLVKMFNKTLGNADNDTHNKIIQSIAKQNN